VRNQIVCAGAGFGRENRKRYRRTEVAVGLFAVGLAWIRRLEPKPGGVGSYQESDVIAGFGSAYLVLSS
jgi:hypothetical protein